MEDKKEKSQEEMVKEALEEAKKAKAAEETDEAVETGPEEGAVKEAGEQTEETEEAGEQPGDAEEADAEAAVDEEQAEEQTEEADTEAAVDKEQTEEESDEEDNAKKAARKLFGKKNKKDKKDEKIEELTDRLTRQIAEFDNFRKRTEKEKSHMYEVGAKDIIDKILPVVDNFERGLGAVKEEEKENPFVQGMEMVYKQLMTTLEGVGVTPIEAVGKEFNPDFHNAVMHVEDENFGENIVAEEFQKGYMYRDSVVRHSMVKVAN